VAGAFCEVVASSHALDEMEDEDIGQDEVRETILRGARQPLKGGKVRAKLAGVGVIYKVKPCHWWVITAFRG